MIGYADKTWCNYLDCTNKDCHRRLTPQVIAGAQKWWGNQGAPICQFAEKPECYKEDTNV